MIFRVWSSKGTHTTGKHTQTLNGPLGRGTGSPAGKWRDFTLTFCSSYKILINHLGEDLLKPEIHKNDSPSSRFMKFGTKVKTIHCNGVLSGSSPFLRPPFTPKSGNGFPLAGCAQGEELDHSHRGFCADQQLLLVQLEKGLFLTLGLGNDFWCLGGERKSRGQTQDSSDFVAKLTLGCSTVRKSQDCWLNFKRKKMGLKLYACSGASSFITDLNSSQLENLFVHQASPPCPQV